MRPPRRHLGWSCPYFLLLMFTGVCVIAASFLDGPPVVDAAAIVIAFLCGAAVAIRESGHCPT